MLAADKEAVRRIAAAACVAAIEARENAVAIGALAGNTAEAERSAGDPILQGCGLRMSRRFAEAEQGQKTARPQEGVSLNIQITVEKLANYTHQTS